MNPDIFDWTILSKEDSQTAARVVGSYTRLSTPDLVIAPDGKPYLYRWHLLPRNKAANIYFHIQVESDPERPLHDHPWANTSVILSGGYDEIVDPTPWLGIHRFERRLRSGDVACRTASEAHRLILPSGIPYTMTLFTTGPKIRDWGFWFDNGWRDAEEVTALDPATRRSIHTGVKADDAE